MIQVYQAFLCGITESASVADGGAPTERREGERRRENEK